MVDWEGREIGWCPQSEGAVLKHFNSVVQVDRNCADVDWETGKR